MQAKKPIKKANVVESVLLCLFMNGNVLCNIAYGFWCRLKGWLYFLLMQNGLIYPKRPDLSEMQTLLTDSDVLFINEFLDHL